MHIIARTLAPRHKRRVRLATTALVAPPSLPAPTVTIHLAELAPALYAEPETTARTRMAVPNIAALELTAPTVA